ncbi:MAG: hypothetical protein WBL44_15530 [Nitrososphaeraceae archaeon]
MLCLAMAAAIILADKGSNNTPIPMTFAQSSGNTTLPLNKTQEWISQKDAVKILFTYQPERPIIDTFTKLEFRVINLTSNENLKDFDARVVVTNGQRLFKFENITVPDGNFSVEYIFPDDGTHQVLTRIDKESAVRVLASFNVFVPHQAPPSILNPFPIPPGSELGENPVILLSIILAIMLPAAGVLGLIVIFKMGKTKMKRN